MITDQTLDEFLDDLRKSAVSAHTQQQAASIINELHRLQHELNHPQTRDFIKAVMNEAAHQRHRWGADHDAGKKLSDWFWLVGYLTGKVLYPDADGEKRRHRIVATAAACANWFLHEVGVEQRMRPGIETPQGEREEA